MAVLCNADKNLPIKIEVWSKNEAGTDALYGGGITTVNELSSGQKNIELLNNANRTGGTIIFDSFQIVEMPCFMDYLRSGWAINMSFAIDFTASNGERNEPGSLHFMDPSGYNKNQYEKALTAVGSVVEPYAMNQQFATFGFGGIPRFMGSNSVSHCFNLSAKPDPTI